MDGPLNSYLIDIAGAVAGTEDPKTGAAMLDIIQDKAGQKGTGRWSVIEGLHLGAPVGLMSAAVEARIMSAEKEQRIALEGLFGPAPQPLGSALGTRAETIEALRQALIAAKTCAYVQGFEVLRAASEGFGWKLDLAAIARVWRAGCIIRSVFLDEISNAFDSDKVENLSFAPVFRTRLDEHIPALRIVVAQSVAHGLAAPALFAALSYHDMGRTSRSTANMIQGLRDYFGAHSFERTDAPGEKVNGPWRK
jgi:6-phosphogluconate dehydrogenase